MINNKQIPVSSNAKALIFDIDGTLADTMQTHFSAYRKVLGAYGVDFGYDLFMSIAGTPVIPQMHLIKEMFQPANFDPEKVAAQKEDEYIKTINTTKPIKKVFDVFNSFNTKMPVACGTGADKRIAVSTLKALGIYEKVPVLVTCDDVLHGKPAPDTFLQCAKLLGVEPQYCQVFEDGNAGIEAAKNAGMMVVNVLDYL